MCVRNVRVLESESAGLFLLCTRLRIQAPLTENVLNMRLSPVLFDLQTDGNGENVLRFVCSKFRTCISSYVFRRTIACREKNKSKIDTSVFRSSTAITSVS